SLGARTAGAGAAIRRGNSGIGAQDKTRTYTTLRSLAPEASASTNSATWANGAGRPEGRPAPRRVFTAPAGRSQALQGHRWRGLLPRLQGGKLGRPGSGRDIWIPLNLL